MFPTSFKATASFASIKTDNEALGREIRGYASRHQVPAQSRTSADADGDGGGELKVLLRKLYSRICDFRVFRRAPSTPDKKILATWESFLDPIRSLAEVQPDGLVIAARMVLYLATAFRQDWHLPHIFPDSASSLKPIDQRFGFLLALDDALLAFLAALWEQSRHRATFKWVATAHPVEKLYHTCVLPEDIRNDQTALQEYRDQREQEQVNTACLTRLHELTPANGVVGGRLWQRADGDTGDMSRHPDATRWNTYDDGEGRKVLAWQYIGSDGPIRMKYEYDLVNEDIWPRQYKPRSRYMLRRSRQFISDARRISARLHFEESQVSARNALARRLPVELQDQILGYLDADRPPEHPYFSRLDLSGVYQPFPDISSTSCDECRHRGNKGAGRMASLTCPRRSLTFWNAPLRAFHTMHALGPNRWGLCAHKNCTGHHHDSSWHLQEGLGGHINEIVDDRCGPGTSMTDINLGPTLDDLYALSLETEKNISRRAQLPWDLVPGHSDAEEADKVSVGGLAILMRYREDRPLTSSPWGRATWMLGRTRQQEARALAALRDIRD